MNLTEGYTMGVSREAENASWKPLFYSVEVHVDLFSSDVALPFWVWMTMYILLILRYVLFVSLFLSLHDILLAHS